ncbi:MAG: FAD-binding protein [Deltaproteobacteria bacterium]|nr:MAG: FAD-binding protein [Deltaproteobacteria bacterium]
MIRTGSDSDLVLKPDVCIVGSGPGGAMVAARLARAGAKVVVLEEGGYHRKDEFDMQEATAFPLLYQDRGNRATADLSISVLQGRAVGGGTVVNWTTSYRTPDDVLAYWRDHFGLALTPSDLRPHFEEVEQRLGIQKVDLEDTNANNRAIYDGCTKMGWQVDTTKRNVRGCLRTGYCGMGCPVDAKQSATLTYLPDAVAAGADVYANCRVSRIEW